MAAFFSIPAHAMPGAGAASSAHASSPEERLQQMDTDHSGSLSWEELSAARPNLNRNAFDTIDANHDGQISMEEWKTFSSGHGGAAPTAGMNGMMKAMRSAAPGKGAENAMPLIMPPKENPCPGSSGMGKTGMPLITPPSGKK